MSTLAFIAAATLFGAGGGYGLARLQHRQDRVTPLAVLQRQVEGFEELGERRAKYVRVLEQGLRARLDAQTDRVSALDDQQSEQGDRLTRVVADTLELGNELKGQIQVLEQRLDAVVERQQSFLQAIDGQLQEMQQFIVRTAEDAARQRAALPQSSPAVVPAGADWRQGAQAAPAAAAPALQQQQPVVSEDELAQLLTRQQVLQQQFAQRRRSASGEAAFRMPNGAGL